MANPVKTSILQNLVTTLQGINTAAGYERTIKTVTRSAAGIPAMAAMDAACILSCDIRKEHLCSCTVCTMTVLVMVMAEERYDLPTAIDDLEAAVEKALAVDITRGGFALDTKVVGAREAVSEELEGLGGSVIEIEIKFRHTVGDPYPAGD